MSDTRSLTYLETPRSVWIKCEDAEQLTDNEVACVVAQVSGPPDLVIVSPKYCDVERKLIRGVYFAYLDDDSNQMLVDILTSGRRVVISEEQVAPNGNSL